jgi:hypothetical protein
MDAKGLGLVWKVSRKRQLAEVGAEPRIYVFKQFPSVVSSQPEVMKNFGLGGDLLGANVLRKKLAKRLFGVLHHITMPADRQGNNERKPPSMQVRGFRYRHDG